MTEETTPAVHSAPFLSRITLRNFKSVVGQDVSLAPLTLIVGENSSGKSSLLQAVRLMQQAARSKTPGDSFPLNGDSISVGNIEDVRSAQTEEEESVSIGFDLCISYSFDDDHSDHKRATCMYNDDCRFCNDYMHIGDWIESTTDGFIIRWKVDLRAEQSGSTVLKNTHFSLTNINGDGSISINIEIIKEKNGNREIIGTINHEQKTDIYSSAEAIPIIRVGEEIDHEDIPDIDSPIRVHNIELSGALPAPPEALTTLSKIGLLRLQIAQREMAERAMTRIMEGVIKGEQEQTNVLKQLQIVLNDSRYVHKLCEDNIKYLGPLREPPDKPTQRPSLGQTGDIGPSGEFTASVLQRFGNDTVLAPTPDGESSEMPLIEAVQVWGRHLRLLRSIRVVQEAKLGNVITVESEGLNKEVPLDTVGVGVSQLLPVLVLCLLSEPGSMILLEQPELHLHPALQQRLADFLIAAARSGRQLIVETHSEYIVSRLRRRIAEDTSDEDELLSMSKIVFAERDPQTGVTTYREVELSPFGKIEDWPRGFFDQASEEEREIIRSGFRKIAEREDRLTEPE